MKRREALGKMGKIGIAVGVAAAAAAAGTGAYFLYKPPEKPVEVPTPKKEVTITVWTQETPPHRVARQKSIIKMFEAENPGIKVELVPVGW